MSDSLKGSVPISGHAAPPSGPWRAALSRPESPLATIHIWRFSITAWRGTNGLTRFLSQEELKRLESFRSKTRGESFLVGRAALRLLLSGLLDTSPEEVNIVNGAGGRPQLEDDLCPKGLTFSLSHSGNWILIALRDGGRIGVDIEIMRDSVAMEAIAKRFFYPEEAEAVCRATDSTKKELFFTLWTMKEACLKATGRGMAAGLGSFSVLPADKARPSEASESPFSRVFSCGLLCLRIPFEDMYIASIAGDPPITETLLFDCSPALFL